MAVTPCRECGKEVSTAAKTCPHCGVNRPGDETANRVDQISSMGKSFMGCGCSMMMLALLVPVVLFGLVMCAGIATSIF